MKKILLLIILSISFLNSEAKDSVLNSLNKIHESKINLQRVNSNKLSTLEYLPTLTRISNRSNNTWTVSRNIKLDIQNSQKVALYELGDLLSDTFSQITYTYDNINRLESETLSETNQFGVLMPRRRSVYTYTSFNNESTTTTIIENYDQQTTSWKTRYKHVRVYNSRGALIKSLDYSFSDNMWLIENYYTTKISYLNNTSNKTTEIIDSAFHFITGSMIVYRKILTTYDAQERETAIKIYYPITNGYDLVIDEVDSFYYSNSQMPNNIVRYTYYDDGDIENRFKFGDISFNNFNPNLSVFENEFQSYLIYYYHQNKYELSSRYSVTYPDNFGSRIELLEQYDIFLFKPAYKNNYLYDSHHKLVEESSQRFNLNTYSWETEWGNRNQYKYDNNNNTTELIEQYYNDVTNSYIDQTKYEYFDYQLVNTSIRNTAVGSISIYPNPAHGNLINIRLSLKNAKPKELTIYNLQGIEMMKEQAFTADILNIERLQPGIYLIEIKTDKNEKIISKFIKE